MRGLGGGIFGGLLGRGVGRGGRGRGDEQGCLLSLEDGNDR